RYERLYRRQNETIQFALCREWRRVRDSQTIWRAKHTKNSRRLVTKGISDWRDRLYRGYVARYISFRQDDERYILWRKACISEAGTNYFGITILTSNRRVGLSRLLSNALIKRR